LELLSTKNKWTSNNCSILIMFGGHYYVPGHPFTSLIKVWTEGSGWCLQGVGHIALAGILWMRSQNVDLKSRAAIAAWYMFIWKVSIYLPLNLAICW
jgi:hypothetical protein